MATLEEEVLALRLQLETVTAERDKWEEAAKISLDESMKSCQLAMERAVEIDKLQNRYQVILDNSGVLLRLIDQRDADLATMTEQLKRSDERLIEQRRLREECAAERDTARNAQEKAETTIREALFWADCMQHHNTITDAITEVLRAYSPTAGPPEPPRNASDIEAAMQKVLEIISDEFASLEQYENDLGNDDFSIFAGDISGRLRKHLKKDVACPECLGRGFQCDSCAPMGRDKLAYDRAWIRIDPGDPATWPEDGVSVRWWRQDEHCEVVGFREHDAYGHWCTLGTPEHPGSNLRLGVIVTHWLPLTPPPCD